MKPVKVSDLLAGSGASFDYHGSSSGMARGLLVAAALAISAGAGSALAADGAQIEMTGSPGLMAQIAKEMPASRIVIAGVPADVAGTDAGAVGVGRNAAVLLKYKLNPTEVGLAVDVRNVMDVVQDPLGKVGEMRFSEGTRALMEVADLNGSVEQCIGRSARSGIVAALRQCLSPSDVAVRIGQGVADHAASAVAIGQGALGAYLIGPSQVLGGAKSVFFDQARSFEKAVDLAIHEKMPGYSSGKVTMPDGTEVSVRYDAWSGRGQTNIINANSSLLWDREEYARYESLTLNPAVAKLESEVERVAYASKDLRPDFFARVKDGSLKELEEIEADVPADDDSHEADPVADVAGGLSDGPNEPRTSVARPKRLGDMLDFVRNRDGRIANAPVPVPLLKPAVPDAETDPDPDAGPEPDSYDDLSGAGPTI